MTARQLADLFDRHGPALAAFARLRCAAAAEDAVQDAFCRLARQLVPPLDPAAWLFRVVRNRSLDAARAERRRKRRESAVSAARPAFHDPDPGDGADAAAALAALQALPEELREAVALRIWSSLTLAQVAAACGCSVSAAHRRYEAGVRALRERLTDPREGEPCPTTRSRPWRG